MKALDEGRAVHRRVILDVREVIQQWRIIFLRIATIAVSALRLESSGAAAQ